MTMPNERTRAAIRAHSFLVRLSSPYLPDGIKKIPKDVREEARRILRHYPHPMDFRRPDQFDPETIEEYYEEMDRQWERVGKG